MGRGDAIAVTGLDDAIKRLQSYAEVGADGLYVDAPESVEQLREISRRLKPLGKPLVAAVNGDAHAGGFSVVVGCDLAVMADDATLGLPEAAKGLFPFIALAIVRDALEQARVALAAALEIKSQRKD